MVRRSIIQSKKIISNYFEKKKEFVMKTIIDLYLYGIAEDSVIH